MKKVVYYKLVPDLNLMIEVFCGDIYYSDVLELKAKQIKDTNFNPKYNGLVDVTNANLHFSFEEIETYKKYITTIKGFMGDRKTSIYTKTPNQVMLSTIYITPDSKIPMHFQVFSTLKASLNWIGMSLINEKRIKEILDSAS